VGKDQTGEYSVFADFEEHEIMFHVSTLLPFSSEDRQQVSRGAVNVRRGRNMLLKAAEWPFPPSSAIALKQAYVQVPLMPTSCSCMVQLLLAMGVAFI